MHLLPAALPIFMPNLVIMSALCYNERFYMNNILLYWNRLKTLDAVQGDLKKTELKKTLTAFDLIILGLGGIIGSGIFVITGLAAAKYAGPGIIFSFILAAASCTFTALAYSELAALIPTSGGAYTYAFVSSGELIATLVGWLTILYYTLAAAVVSVGWSGYATGLLKNIGIIVPEVFTKTVFDGGVMNLPAVCIIWILALASIRGTKMISKFNAWLVFIKLAAIFTFIGLAIPHIDPVNWNDFLPFGWKGVFSGAGVIFLAFGGFDAIATAAEECKNPNRDIPIGVIGSLFISAALYIIVSACLTGICHYALLENPQPIAFALYQNSITFGGKIVASGALAGLTTVILTMIFGLARILMVMSRDGILPSFFQKIHPRFGTPYKGILMSGLIVSFVAGITPVGKLSEMVSMCSLLTFIFISWCVLTLRIRYPEAKRSFRCPLLFWIAPISGVLCCFLFWQLFSKNAFEFLTALSGGLFLYIFYSSRHLKRS
jgi:APA family basic amino acid/polyamine antiporter